MRDGVTVAYRGARFEIGRARHCYAIWAIGAPREEPLHRWPETPHGWAAAWSYLMTIEVPGTVAPARTSPAAVMSTEIVSAALLVAGVALGVVGLFPRYLNGASLVQQPAELVPHVTYLAVWSAAAAAIILGSRQRTWALLGAGTAIVTFGLFFADAGTVMAGGAHVMGAGVVLALAGWLACAAGAAIGLRLGPEGGPARPLRSGIPAIGMLVLAAAGAAAAFAPAWDSYVLRSAAGQEQTVTAGNAFVNPVPVIAGNVAVMAALVAVVTVAALWRPPRQGAALLVGAIVPMAAQAVSALLQVRQATSPAQFGISPSQAQQAGITVSNGLTPAFWIYCAFVIALIVSCAWLLITPPGTGPALTAAPTAAPEAGVTGFPEALGEPSPGSPPAGAAEPGIPGS
jgi:uncharacterized membrane protein